MQGGERLRLFCGLRLPDEILDRVGAWQREHLRGRVVGRENLHVTLAFLGSRPAEDAAAIAAALASVPAFAPILFRVHGYRETRSVGMLVLDDLTGSASAAARHLHEQLELLGVYEREQRRWLSHLTVLRFRVQPRLRPPAPDLGTFAPSEAAVYLSRLRPGGAQYQVLESFPVGGSPSGS